LPISVSSFSSGMTPFSLSSSAGTSTMTRIEFCLLQIGVFT
jgi:hypothetical protein